VKLQSLDEFLSDKPNRQQYEELMKKMKENGDLTDAEKSYIQQINVIKGGDSVSQSSSTGFSTKKSAYNDDYTMQALVGSMP
jgi:deoxyribose-phosphate aldolase